MALFAALLPAAVVLSIVYVLLSRARLSSKAKALGCEPAPLFRPWDILGIKSFRLEMNGMRTNRLSNAFVYRKTEMSRVTGRNCKTFRIKYPPGETWYYTFDPVNLQAVLATQFQDFQQSAARIAALQPLLGVGIFSSNGARWEHSRALLRPQFMRDQIADLDLFGKHVEALLDALPGPTEPGDWTAIFDLQPFLERFTMDTASEFLLGESVHSQKIDDRATSKLFSKLEMMNFVDAFFKAEKTTAMSMIWADLYWLSHDQKFKDQCKVVHNFVDTYVQRRLKSGDKPNKGKYVVLDALVADVTDVEDLRSQLLNILLAGSDTISGTLGFLFASLAQYPDVFDKLRQAVIDDFGTVDEHRQITLSKLKDCSYLQWVINEVLRVYPAVPVNFREAVRDTTLPTGGGPDGTSPVFIPKGFLVAWEVWTIHSDPGYWGPDAGQFKPERWKGRKFGFNYLPFNAGPRICIGQQFALAEVAYVTVRLLQRFDSIDGTALPNGRLPCDWKLVDKVAGGVNIRLRCAKRTI